MTPCTRCVKGGQLEFLQSPQNPKQKQAAAQKNEKLLKCNYIELLIRIMLDLARTIFPKLSRTCIPIFSIMFTFLSPPCIVEKQAF